MTIFATASLRTTPIRCTSQRNGLFWHKTVLNLSSIGWLSRSPAGQPQSSQVCHHLLVDIALKIFSVAVFALPCHGALCSSVPWRNFRPCPAYLKWTQYGLQKRKDLPFEYAIERMDIACTVYDDTNLSNASKSKLCNNCG